MTVRGVCLIVVVVVVVVVEEKEEGVLLNVGKRRAFHLKATGTNARKAAFPPLKSRQSVS